GLAAVAAAVGIAGSAALLNRFATDLPAVVSWVFAAAAAVVAAGIIDRSTRLASADTVAGVSVATLAAAGFSAAAGYTALGPHTAGRAGLSLLLTAAAGLVGVLASVAVARVPPAVITAITTVGCLGCLTAVFGTVATTPQQFLAGTTAVALITVVLSPTVCVHLAGLGVPALAPAGEQMPDPPTAGDGTETKAETAVGFLTGITAGAAAAGAPAIAFVGWHGGPVAAALCIAVAGGLALHTDRLRTAAGRWALHVWTLSAVAGLIGNTLVNGHEHLWVLAAGVAATAIVYSACAWAPYVRELSPPMIRHLERLEVVCIAVAIPLAAHLSGLFTAIRGVAL
ncbi:hypothetical protein JZY06_05280, partial [Corynebacterium sp. CCM 8862]